MDYIKTLKKQYKNIEPDELFNMIETNLYNLINTEKEYTYKIIKSDYDKNKVNKLISKDKKNKLQYYLAFKILRNKKLKRKYDEKYLVTESEPEIEENSDSPNSDDDDDKPNLKQQEEERKRALQQQQELEKQQMLAKQQEQARQQALKQQQEQARQQALKQQQEQARQQALKQQQEQDN